MDTHEKFETDTIKIKNYRKNKPSDVVCNICSHQWKVMVKRIKTSHCPKCPIAEKLATLEKDEFITFDEGEDVNYSRDIFSYKCNACDRKFAKTLYNISLEGPCVSYCPKDLDRAKIVAQKVGCKCLGYSKGSSNERVFSVENKEGTKSTVSYTADEWIDILRPMPEKEREKYLASIMK